MKQNDARSTSRHEGEYVDLEHPRSPVTVARWAGHTDAAFMERVYGHLWRNDHTDTRDAIATLLGGGQV